MCRVPKTLQIRKVGNRISHFAFSILVSFALRQPKLKTSLKRAEGLSKRKRKYYKNDKTKTEVKEKRDKNVFMLCKYSGHRGGGWASHSHNRSLCREVHKNMYTYFPKKQVPTGRVIGELLPLPCPSSCYNVSLLLLAELNCKASSTREAKL